MRYGTGLAVFGAIAIAVAALRPARSAPEVRVLTAPVTRGRVANEVTAIGTLQAVTTVQVGSQVSGRIAWLGADYNSVVRKGQVIARLDQSLLQAQVDQSRASLVRAQAEVERARVQLTDAEFKHERATQLSVKGLIPRSDFDAASVALLTARAQVRSAEAQAVQAQAALSQNQVSLSQAVITAPIDGIVIQRNVDVGQTVSASMSSPTLFTIAADLTEMRLSVGVDESDVANIRPKQAAAFRVDAYPDDRFPGVVSQVRLEPTVTQNVVTYAVVIEVPNPDLKLRPGMTAHATVEVAVRDDAMRVPNAALRFRPTPAMFSALNQTPPPAPAPVMAGDGEDEYFLAAGSNANGPGRTIDALFNVVNFPERDGQVWVYVEGRLQPVAVRVGLSDAQTTELVAGDLREGVELVTNMTVDDAGVRPATPAGGFFMNQPALRPNSGRRG
jgi:HlyD family secretion protein